MGFFFALAAKILSDLVATSANTEHARHPRRAPRTLPSPFPHPGGTAQSVGGKYTVNGTNFDGSPYKGTATITRSSNSTCAINWVTGTTTSVGFCMLANKSFAAAYKLGEKGEETEVLVVDEAGAISPVWVYGQHPYPPRE